MTLISREDAIEVVAQQFLFEASAESPYVNDDDIDEYRKLADKLFEDIPTVDAVPVRPGKWIEGELYIRCSECGYPAGHLSDNYCPNCGADMRGEAE